MKPALDPRKAVALLRVSTDDQPNGHDVQRADVQRYADAHGLTVVAWHVETASGGASLDERPELAEAMANLSTLRAGTFVAQKWDRITRDPSTAIMLEDWASRHGATIVVADGVGNGTDPTAELLRGMLVLFGRFERRLIGARTRAALGRLKASGKRLGRPSVEPKRKPRARRAPGRPMGAKDSPAAVARRTRDGVPRGRPRLVD